MLIALLVIIGLAVLILGHEAGHFAVAKLFNMKVDEFGFGFPPRIFAWRPKKKITQPDGTIQEVHSETEYSLNWLPFGGFVRIAGETDSPVEVPTTEGTREVPLEIESASAAPVSSDDPRLFYNQAAYKRALVTIAGVTVNFLIGWILLSFVFMVGTPTAVVIVGLDKNTPAAQAGIQSGDIVVNYSLLGQPATKAVSVQDFTNFVNANRGKEIDITVRRQSGTKDIHATPQPDRSKPGLGVELNEAGTARMGFFAAFGAGLRETGYFARLTLGAFGQLLANLFVHAQLLQGVVGPIGIFSVAQETGNIALIYLLQLLALISINLAVINLVPFPALDGGRLIFILIEKLKGSPVPRKIEGWVNSLGFAFLIVLIILISIRDISHWF